MGRVLIVDDNDNLRQMFALRLRRHGLEADTAENGPQALVMIAGRKYDAVLLDIMMPGIDGLETLRAVRRTHSPTELPVIMSTARDQADVIVEALRSGANDYVTKPHNADVLLARINTQLAVSRMHRELRARHDAFEEELQTLAHVQRSLLPDRLPEIRGLGLAAHYLTSRYAGGDYYDIVRLPDDQWGFLIADVSGHGTRCAVLMAMTCAFLRAYPRPPYEPDRVIDYLNSSLGQFADGMAGGMFVTALYAVYHAGRRTLRIARAGHVPPLHYRASLAAAEELDCPTVPPLGLVAYDRVPVAEFRVHPGDKILFYTDGITERFSPARELYGVQRLRAQLARTDGAAPHVTVEAIVRDLAAFAGDQPSADDQALLLGVVQ